MKTPSVIWITGLSASGKTTMGEALASALKERGITVEHLDGDRLRKLLPGTGFSKEDRNRHIQRVGYLAGLLEKNGITVIATFISPYRESRLFARKQCENFIEIFLSTPLMECERRDPKGLYKKARSGEIKQFTGIDDPYESPENPEIKMDTSQYSIDDACNLLLKQLDQIE